MAIREWYRPRRHQSFLNRWLRTFLLMVSAAPVVYLFHHFFSGVSWYGGFRGIVGMSFLYAHFHVYRGTDEDYPRSPSAGSSSK